MTDGDNWLEFRRKNFPFHYIQGWKKVFIFHPTLGDAIWKDLETEVSLCWKGWVGILFMMSLLNVGGGLLWTDVAISNNRLNDKKLNFIVLYLS